MIRAFFPSEECGISFPFKVDVTESFRVAWPEVDVYGTEKTVVSILFRLSVSVGQVVSDQTKQALLALSRYNRT
jgi:hypothetical protein